MTSDILDLFSGEKKAIKEDPPLKIDSPFIFGHAADYPALSAVIKHIHGTRGIAAGGAFKNVFTGSPVKDIDVFFRCEKDWMDAYATLKDRGYTDSYETKRVKAVICPNTHVRVELVGNDYNDFEDIFDTPEGILSKFDFTLTKFAVFLQGEEWMVLKHKDFFEHLQTKRIVIDDILVKPISTFERALRYTGYGYKMCRESKVKLIQEIQETDFESTAQLGAGFYDGID